MSLINNGKQTATLGSVSSAKFEYDYPINYSIKLKRATTDYLYRTCGTVDSATKWTFSTWVKRASNGVIDSLICGWDDTTTYSYLVLGGNDEYVFVTRHSGTIDGNVRPSNLLRDPSQWYHLFFIYDTTEAVGADRSKFYINGVFYAHDSTDVLNSGTGSRINQTGYLNYLCRERKNVDFADIYLAETHLLDGIIGDVNDFGEFKYNTWIPKEYTGGHGSDGWHLDYAASGDLGNDVSGNNNDWTAVNTPAQSLDTPTNNHPILDSVHDLSTATISNAGLTCSGTENEYATVHIPSKGKWSWEITVAENGSFGLEDVEGNEEVAADVSGEVVEMLVDMDSGTLKKKVDGGSLETIEASLNTSATWLPHFKAACSVDFGEGSYTPSEAGYKTLCTANWPDSQIPVVDSDQGLWINTREGTGAAANVTGASFNTSTESLVWIKNRDAADSHRLVDTVRGATEELVSDTTAAENTDANGLTAFLTNGFSLGTGAGGYNDSAESFVDWVFNMLPKYGMDIVTYEGTGVARTVAHNLGAAPELMLVKQRDIVNPWIVYCETMSSTPEEDYLILNDTDALGTASTLWNDTAPTSSVFTVGTAFETNKSGGTFVAYLFRSIPGFLKVGYYIGNGSADGPRVHTGFLPRYILIKNISAAQSWCAHDTERDPYNVADHILYPDLTNAEYTALDTKDFLANGFKIRNTNAAYNTSANRYIYLAIGDPYPYVNAF